MALSDDPEGGLEAIADAIHDNADWFESQSVAKANAFVTAATQMIALVGEDIQAGMNQRVRMAHALAMRLLEKAERYVNRSRRKRYTHLSANNYDR